MPNEIGIGLIFLAVAIIGTATWLVKFLPKYIEQQVAAKEREREDLLESEKQERDSRITELTARIEENKTLVSQIARSNDLQERLINNIVDISKEQSTANKVVAANTSAITGNTEALGELNKTVDGYHESSVIRLDRIDIILKDVVEKVEKLPHTVEAAKVEILAAIEKCRDTSTNPVTVNVNPAPAVLIPDTDANGAASVPTAA